MKYENQYAHHWTEQDNLALIAAYNAGIKVHELGPAIGWSHNTARHHLMKLLRANRVEHRNITARARKKCTGDCDKCPFPDCKASARTCVKLQNKQERERYSKLPPCDQHAIDWRNAHKNTEVGELSRMSKMDRPLSRRKMGDYIRDRLDQEHEAHPEGDDISRKAMAYGHRKPYSGSQYYLQQRREKQERNAGKADSEDPEYSSNDV